MKPVSGKVLCRALERHGWKRLRVKGSHHIYGREAPFGRVVVPVHGNKTLPPGTQRSIMRAVGLSDQDLAG